MLTGQALGKAIAEAIRLKGVTRQAVADHFGVKQPSTYDWTKHGRIDKKHLTGLVAYFADVVGPEHWGMAESDWLPAFERPHLGAFQAADEARSGGLFLGRE